jgi:hypothetical protein
VKFGLLASLKDSGQLDAGFPLSEYSLSVTDTGELLVSRSCDPLLAEHVASILPFAVVGDDGASVTLFVQKPSDYIVAEMTSDFVKQFIVRRDAKRRDATGAIEPGTTFEDSAPVTLGTNATLGWDDGTGRIYGVDDLTVSGKGTLGSGQSPTVTTNVATVENATVENGVVTETLAFSGGGEDARLATSSSAGTWFRVSDGSGVTHLTVARNGELYLSNGSANQVYHTGNIGSLGADATWFDRGSTSSSTYSCNFVCGCTYSIKQPDTSSCGCNYTYMERPVQPLETLLGALAVSAPTVPNPAARQPRSTQPIMDRCRPR